LVPATLRTRISRGVHEVAASEVVQMRLGEAAAAIETAVLIMHTRRAESIAALETGAAITPEAVARNRRDVTFAAQQLRRGMETLMEVSGVDRARLKSSDLGFRLGPRINAAGRLGRYGRGGVAARALHAADIFDRRFIGHGCFLCGVITIRWVAL